MWTHTESFFFLKTKFSIEAKQKKAHMVTANNPQKKNLFKGKH